MTNLLVPRAARAVDAPAQAWKEISSPAIISETPAVTPFKTGLYVLARGSDGHVYGISTANGSTWSNWKELPGSAAVPSAPAVAFFNNKLYAIIRKSDTHLYWNSSSDGVKWDLTDWKEFMKKGPKGDPKEYRLDYGLGRDNVDSPSAVVHNGKLYVFVRQLNTLHDNPIAYTYFLDGTWALWQGVSAPFDAVDSPGTASFNGRFYLFARRADNRAVFTSAPEINATFNGNRYTTEGVFDSWKELPGTVSSAITAAAVNGRLHAVVRWSDGHVYSTSTRNGGSWTEWTELPGSAIILSAPGVASLGDQLYSIVRGGGDSRVYSHHGFSTISLQPGDVLRQGEYLPSRNSKYFLTLGDEGVLYVCAGANPSDNRGVSWSSQVRGTPGVTNYGAVMQPNGNLAVYENYVSDQSYGKLVWQSGTAGSSYALVEDSGNFGIFAFNGVRPATQDAARWRSLDKGAIFANLPGIPATPQRFIAPLPNDTPGPAGYQLLRRGSKLYSKNMNYYGIIEGSSFRVYKNNPTPTLKWSSTFDYRGGDDLAMVVSSDGYIRICPIQGGRLLQNVKEFGNNFIGRPTGPFFVAINDDNGSMEIYPGHSPVDGHGAWKIFPEVPRNYTGGYGGGGTNTANSYSMTPDEIVQLVIQLAPFVF